MIRLALSQVNTVVGDLTGNSALVRGQARLAQERGADLVVFPEMTLTGYPVEDLALRPSFQDASVACLHQLARDLVSDGLGDLICIVGYLDHLDATDLGIAGRPRRAPVNAAAVLHRGQVVGRYIKHHLPNYGVFDESRYFVPGEAPLVLRYAGTTICLAICEDLWQQGGPITWARADNAGLLLVLNASPYERDKDDVRFELCRDRARESGAVIAYANLVGGQDELVFDGDSMVVLADGTLVARAGQFTEELLLADVEIAESEAPEAFLSLEAEPRANSDKAEVSISAPFRACGDLRCPRRGPSRLRGEERLPQRASRHVWWHRFRACHRDCL